MMRIAGNQQNEPRKLNDGYATDPRWTRILLNNVRLVNQVWEPAAGEGKMVKELKAAGYSVVQSDISRGRDFLRSRRRASTIVTNPPYSKASAFMLHALEQADNMVCMLLGWHLVAGGKERYETIYNAIRPELIVVIVERMRLDHTTSQFNHAWVVWNKTIKVKKTRLIWSSIGDLECP